MEFDGHQLPALNAILNGMATLLLMAGYVLIKQRRERAHIVAMLSAFVMSILFLTSYLVYHIGVQQGQSTPFTGQGIIRPIYYTILVSHILLAAAVPVLAIVTIYYGYRNRRKHRKVARWTFPIWLYVSVTGVVIYLMLYQLYPPAQLGFIMAVQAAGAA